VTIPGGGDGTGNYTAWEEPRLVKRADRRTQPERFSWNPGKDGTGGESFRKRKVRNSKEVERQTAEKGGRPDGPKRSPAREGRDLSGRP